MSYGGANNPPWQRNANNQVPAQQQQQQQQIPSLQSQMGLPNPNLVGYPSSANQSIYSTNMAMNHQQQHQQQQMQQQQQQVAIAGVFAGPQTVAYPTRGGQGGGGVVVGGGQGGPGQLGMAGGGGGPLNPNAFGQPPQQQQPPPAPVISGTATTSSRIGTVTKIQADFGFIDEEVFFHRNSCKGSFPKLGDRVLVEATFNTNAPFKWNATRVQLMGVNATGGPGGGPVGGPGGGVAGPQMGGMPQQQQQGNPVGMSIPPLVGGLVGGPRHTQPPPQAQHGGGGGMPNNHHSQPPPHHAMQQQPQQHMGVMAGGGGGLGQQRSGPAGYNAVPPPSFGGPGGPGGFGGGLDRPMVGGPGGGGMREPPQHARQQQQQHVQQQQRNLSPLPSRRQMPMDGHPHNNNNSNHHNVQHQQPPQHSNNTMNNRGGNRGNHQEIRGSSHNLTNITLDDEPERRRRRDQRDNRHALDDRDRNSDHRGGRGDRIRDQSVDKVRSSNYSPERRGASPSVAGSQSGGGSSRKPDQLKRRNERQTERERDRTERKPPAPRYMVQVPKVRLDMTEADVLELRRRYGNLYVPSDFFYTEIRWAESFPPNAAFSLNKACAFHIAHRSVDPPDAPAGSAPAVLDAPDCDYLFSAKVMLMGMPQMSDMYRKCFATAEEREQREREEASGTGGERNAYIHPTRVINFLVGLRGKNEAMAIGGPWSPSLDGPNPAGDPAVLIRTAIRTCRALTGIDLTPCTRWYRFVELYYRRAECVRKGRTIPARVETVVIYLPDIRPCIPTRLEWDDLNAAYRRKLDQVLNPLSAIEPAASSADGDAAAAAAAATEPATASSSSAEPNVDANSDQSNGDETTADAGPDGLGAAEAAANTAQKVVVDDDECMIDETAADAAGAVDATIEAAADEPEKDDAGGSAPTSTGAQRDPTPGGELSPRNMKVSELRNELAARGLSPKGLKPQLVARLLKVIKSELQELDENDDDEAGGNDDDEMLDESSAAADESDVLEQTDASDAKAVKQSSSAADIDMADIMVIDEYDSTKESRSKPARDEPAGKSAPGSSGSGTPAAVAARVLDDRDRRDLEKRYKLPEHPRLIVHPSRTAKGGKFTCSSMSLSILLDYRPEDSKEHTFEVSLFAELFNEMLMRDFGFNIYKALVTLPEKTEAKADAKSDAKSDAKVDSKAVAKSSDESKPDSTAAAKSDAPKDADAKDDETKDANDSLADGEPREKRARRSDEEGEGAETANGGDKTVAKRSDNDDTASLKSDSTRRGRADASKTVSRVTVDPELLLSFVYFDQTHCGYILDKDIEELFYTLGLFLSRCQTRVLLQRVINKESQLHYRRLTDRRKDEAAGDATPVPDVDLSTLARGNRVLLPVFRKLPDGETIGDAAGESSNQASGADDDKSNDGAAATGGAMVAYKGGFVDIEKLLDQMRRSEKARTDTEQLLVDLRKDNADLSASATRNRERIRDLQSDVKSYSRRLQDSEQSLSSAQKKHNEYHSILASVYDRVSTVFPSKSSSSRSNRYTSSSSTAVKDEAAESSAKDDKDHKDSKDAKDSKDSKKSEAKQDAKSDGKSDAKADSKTAAKNSDEAKPDGAKGDSKDVKDSKEAAAVKAETK